MFYVTPFRNINRLAVEASVRDGVLLLAEVIICQMVSLTSYKGQGETY